jgi:hypothetical protein
MARLRDIPQLPRAGYRIDVSWDRLEEHLARDRDIPINLEPDYQRGHVWTDEQRIAFVEYGLMGGETSMAITTNCPGWMQDFRGPYEVVDGLQRITAVRMFMRSEIPAFGILYREYEDRLHQCGPSFSWRVLALPTRPEVLRLYLLLNSGGVVHSPEEISRVRALLEDCPGSIPTVTAALLWGE